MLRLLKVIKEIRLYREYLKTVKQKSEESPFFTRMNLRVDWVGRVYTVVNLPQQVIQSPDLPKEARPSFVMNEIKPINEYFKSLNLEELMTLSMESVKGTNDESYLIVYQYVFRNLTILWILRFLGELAIIIFALVKWGHFIF
jgi:hypothetical protein